MTNEPNDTFVSPDTDDLDAFSDLFSGKVKEQVEETKETPEKEPIENETLVEDEETEVEETSETDDDQVEDEKPKKKVSRFQERINELTAKNRESERREAEIQRKLDELTAKQAPTKQPTFETDDGPDPDAKNEDGSDKYPLGEFDPKYNRDLARHNVQKEWEAIRKQEQQEQATRQEQQARAELNTQWQSKMAVVGEEYDDFLDKTMELEQTFEGLDPAYSDYLVTTIKSLDHGPEVLYYFANNLAEAQKFVKLGPQAATLALGKYDAMFGTGKTTPPSKVTKAPPPPQVNKGTKTSKTVAADTDDLDAFSEMFFTKKKF